MYRMSKDEELTLDLLGEFLDEHKQEVNKRYLPLLNAYMSDHEILHAPKKGKNKPDNRIVVNFPKYIVDTLNGFCVGRPIKTTAKSDNVSDYVEHIERYNDTDNINSALFANCGIFGKCYEMYFIDEDTEQRIACLTPIDAFMIYDDSIIESPLHFVRRYVDRNDIEYGSVSNSYGVRYFTVTGGLRWNDNGESGKDMQNGWKAHHYKGVPAVEYIGNDIKQGLFEPVMTQINAYNKAISEKANDVDYFADAYLKVLGTKVEQEDVDFVRDNRIVNFYGDEEADKIIAEFMDRPTNDAAQENLLNRLERHIFQVAMVANISDENFGGSSGTALQYRTLNMSNLKEDKQRKFISGLYRRYKLLFSNPASKVPADAWLELDFNFTTNLPKNLLEESQIATNLEGIVSHETQLKALSIVENVKDELDKIEKEAEEGKESVLDKKILGFSAAVDQQAEGVTNEQ